MPQNVPEFSSPNMSNKTNSDKVVRDRIRALLPIVHPAAGLLRPLASTFVSFAPMRSGQHAVINWLLSQLGPALHLNHCFLRRRLSSYYVEPVDYVTCNEDGAQVVHRHCFDPQAVGRAIAHDFSNLWISFEDQAPIDSVMLRLVKELPAMPVVILRDPLNCLASSVAIYRKGNSGGAERLFHRREILKALLRIALEPETNGSPTIISYNRFVESEEYRAYTAGLFGVRCIKDLSLEHVPDFAGGSSFQGLAKGSELRGKVTTRYRTMESDPLFRELVADSELIELGKSFFQEDMPAYTSISAL